MSINLLYRRPAFVPEGNRTSSVMTSRSSDLAESVRSSKTSTRPHGVPEELSFDRIVAGGTCPPCTLRDFMNYLIYVDHTAEHLQFFLWFKSYTEKFDALPANEKALSPEWSYEQQKKALDEWKSQTKAHRRQPSNATDLFPATIFSKEADVTVTSMGDPFITPPASSHGWSVSQGRDLPHDAFRSSAPTIERGRGGTVAPWESVSVTAMGTNTENSLDTSVESEKHKAGAATVAYNAFDNAGLAQPFTIQPFRKEISHVIQTYITDNSPRQLNLSSRQRSTLLKALEATTHPSAFVRVAEEIELTLRNQLHPNFIRWSICNGNRPRVIFARGLGVALILAGILIELLLTLSNAPRGFRALGAIGLVIGIATLIAAYKGMCVVLHGMHHRHLRPWELFTEDSNDKEGGEGYSLRESVDSVQSSNSYEDAPWIVRYQKRNIVRKVFDREVWIQEPALRQIQDMIFLQSMLCALLISGVVTVIFLVVPKGRLL